MEQSSRCRRPGTWAACVARIQGSGAVATRTRAIPAAAPPLGPDRLASPTLFTSASAGRAPVSLASLSVPRCPMAPRESTSRLHAQSARKEIAEPIAGTSQAHDLELKRLRGEVPCAECKRCDRAISLFVIQNLTSIED
jgi:hypothetical protein